MLTDEDRAKLVELDEVLRVEILDITLDNLDTVLLEHTSLFDRATTDLPELRNTVSTAKDDIAKVHSSLDVQIRDVAAKQGVKITENKIEATIQLDPLYLEALTEYRQAKLDLAQVERTRDLLFQREWSIRELVKLYMGEYWGISGIHDRTVTSDSVAVESVKRSLRAKQGGSRTTTGRADAGGSEAVTESTTKTQAYAKPRAFKRG
jgi:hypothetical protein